MKPWLGRAAMVLVLFAVIAATGCAARSSSQTPTPSSARQQTASDAPTSAPEPSVAATRSPNCTDAIEIRKPVIYLYPPRETAVRVRLAVDGVIIHTEPPLDPVEGWQVLANPSGSLLNTASGRRYPYLFWEADAAIAFDMSSGFVVPGRDTRGFLRDKLATLGLSDSEARSFIDYWSPRMETNAYNLIHFEGPAYERSARLSVSPEPDTRIRVFMAYRPLTVPVNVIAQRLSGPAHRHGFVLVEWGGAELPAH
jgi:hypothetical protein